MEGLWYNIRRAAKVFGYKHPESLRQRIRQLREEGKVSDIGSPPHGYKIVPNAPVTVLWANPKSMMVSSESSDEVLSAQIGRPPAEEKK